MADTTVICDDPEMIDSFSWEDVLDTSPKLKRSSHNSSNWSLSGQFDISANGKDITVYPWDDITCWRFCLLATELISTRYERWTRVTAIENGQQFEVRILDSIPINLYDQPLEHIMPDDSYRFPQEDPSEYDDYKEEGVIRWFVVREGHSLPDAMKELLEVVGNKHNSVYQYRLRITHEEQKNEWDERKELLLPICEECRIAVIMDDGALYFNFCDGHFYSDSYSSVPGIVDDAATYLVRSQHKIPTMEERWQEAERECHSDLLNGRLWALSFDREEFTNAGYDYDAVIRKTIVQIRYENSPAETLLGVVPEVPFGSQFFDLDTGSGILWDDKTAAFYRYDQESNRWHIDDSALFEVLDNDGMVYAKSSYIQMAKERQLRFTDRLPVEWLRAEAARAKKEKAEVRTAKRAKIKEKIAKINSACPSKKQQEEENGFMKAGFVFLVLALIADLFLFVEKAQSAWLIAIMAAFGVLGVTLYLIGNFVDGIRKWKKRKMPHEQRCSPFQKGSPMESRIHLWMMMRCISSPPVITKPEMSEAILSMWNSPTTFTSSFSRTRSKSFWK